MPAKLTRLCFDGTAWIVLLRSYDHALDPEPGSADEVHEVQKAWIQST